MALVRIKEKDSTAILRLEAAWWTPQLAGPVIAAAVVRLVLLALALARTGTAALLLADTSSYLIPGRNLILHGRFVADGVPDLLRTPGYPLFLAITSLAGLPAAALVNVILSVLTVVLVWRLARTAFADSRIALGAAWFFAFEPLSIASSVVLLSETLFLALFLLSMERLAEFLRHRRLPALGVAGLWLAAATFVRPVTYYLPVALALGLFLVLARVPGLRWKAPLVLLISVLPWLAAWQIRNRVETGYSGLTSVSDANLYFFVAADVTARVEHRTFSQVYSELGYRCGADCAEQVYLYPAYLERNPEQAGWTQAQRLAFLHSQAAAVLRAHRGVYLRACLTHLAAATFDPGAGSFDILLNNADLRSVERAVTYKDPLHGAIDLAKADPWIAVEKAAFVLLLLGFYLLAARGVWRVRMHGVSLCLLLGVSLYFLAISAAAAGAGVTARYRLPVMPFVCILAAAGLSARSGKSGAEKEAVA